MTEIQSEGAVAAAGSPRRRLRRPSPSMIVACIALCVSLGGTSYAAIKLPAGSVGTTQLKANAVTGVKVKTGTIQPSDLAPTVEDAVGGARAWAAFTAAGAVNGDTKNFDGVRVAQIQPGIYCGSGLTVQSDSILVSIDAAGGDFGATAMASIKSLDTCPAGTQFEVQTYNASGGYAPQPFYLAIN